MLGKLDSVPVRTLWKNEEQDFTPWLAKDENIQILSDEIGVDIEVESTEVFIGSYKADIVAKDYDGNSIIIENQLGKTDHKHLGQLITYASGVEARFIIWICTEVTDEHRKAIDWLNEVTHSDIGFFACEIELWRIGDSLPAPKFHIIASPNNWAKMVKESPSTKQLTGTKQEHLEFWNGFKSYMEDNKTELRLRTPRPQHWYTIAIGRSKFQISLTRNTQANTVACEIYIQGEDAKQAFYLIHSNKASVESALGALEWMELPDRQDCRIVQVRQCNAKNKPEWPEIYSWLKERSESFHEVFSPVIRGLVIQRCSL